MSVVFVELSEEERDAVVVRMRTAIESEEIFCGRASSDAIEALRKLEDAEPHGRERVR